MGNVSDNENDWKQAIDICKKIEELGLTDTNNYIESLNLSVSIQEKVSNILSGLQQTQPLLEDNNFLTIIDRIKQKPANNNLIGTTIHPYKIIKLLAKGGMSSVYLAESIQKGIKNPIALKILSPYVFSDKSVELFKREQLILSKLNHPNIVSFHHSGKTEDGTNYLVMEYVNQALSIVDYCKNRHLNTVEKVNLILNLAKVFSYSHDNLVIHRDIKPSNLLMDKQGNLKVIDFGIGQLTYRSGNTSTQVFTLDSASPEQIMGKHVNIQTDVFSLGAVLLQLLVEKAPLPKTSIANYDPQNDTKHIEKVLNKSTLDSDLQNIIKVSTHIDLSKRYANMGEFAVDLKNWLDNKPISATSDSLNYRVKKFLQRNKTVSSLVCILLITLLGAVFFVQDLERKNYSIQTQNKSSYALIEAMFDQVNPEINSSDNGEAVTKMFENMAINQSELLKSDPKLENFFYQKLTKLYTSMGLFSQALVANKKALLSLQRYLKPDDDEYLSNRLTIYHLLETTGNLADAKMQGYQFLIDIDQYQSVNPKHRLSGYYLLSKVHEYLKEYDQAVAIGKKAQNWIDKNPNINPLLLAETYNSLAVVNLRMNNRKQALLYYSKAIDILQDEKTHPIRLSAILSNVAVFYGRGGDYVSSLSYFNKAINLVKSVDEKHSSLARIYSAHSTLLRITGKIDESISTVERSIQILLESNQDKRILAESYVKLAKLNFIQFDTNKAMKNIIKAYKNFNGVYALNDPSLFELYQMALSVLIVESDKQLATSFISHIDQLDVSSILNTRQYQAYLIDKSTFEEKEYISNQNDSIVPKYFYSKKLYTKELKIKWLQEHLNELKDVDNILAVWIQSQLYLLKPGDHSFAEYCQSNTKWTSSHKLVIKKMIMESCLLVYQSQTIELNEKINGMYIKFIQQINGNQSLRKHMIDVLTSK